MVQIDTDYAWNPFRESFTNVLLKNSSKPQKISSSRSKSSEIGKKIHQPVNSVRSVCFQLLSRSIFSRQSRMVSDGTEQADDQCYFCRRRCHSQRTPEVTFYGLRYTLGSVKHDWGIRPFLTEVPTLGHAWNWVHLPSCGPYEGRSPLSFRETTLTVLHPSMNPLKDHLNLCAPRSTGLQRIGQALLHRSLHPSCLFTTELPHKGCSTVLALRPVLVEPHRQVHNQFSLQFNISPKWYEISREFQ